MREFIRAFSAFLEVQTVLVAEFYGIIHALEEAQKIGLIMYGWNVIMVCVAFTTRINVPWMLRNR